MKQSVDLRSSLHAKDVESTYGLFEGGNYLSGNVLLCRRQDDWIANFETGGISVDSAVNHGGLARFCMSIVWPNRVDLDVRALSDHELLVDVTARLSQLVNMRVEF